MKTIRVVIYWIFLSFFLFSVVQASKVALVVKDIDSLSYVHEKNIQNILLQKGLDVFLIDKDNYASVDWNDFSLVVVAGRPGNVYGYQHLDDFVADLPVNDIPTIAIDSAYPDDWGWVKPGGMSTISSSKKQEIMIVDNTHPITENRTRGEIIEVHTLKRKSLLDLIDNKHNLITLASLGGGRNTVIGYANSGTELSNGKILNAPIVFFGITNPLYWTDHAQSLFGNSVEWLMKDTDGDGISDGVDNCVDIPNPNQEDSDGDDRGDVCDVCLNDPRNDVDEDGICGDVDNCPTVFNPDQSDSDEDGLGNVCEILPHQVFLDVDNDGVEEIAVNENNVSDDGFEVYSDPNSNTKTLAIDGDFDGMTDWLIDVGKNRIYDKYWDPDDLILTSVSKSKNRYSIDTDDDGSVDVKYDIKLDIFVVEVNTDSDEELEEGLDTDKDGSFDEYVDVEGTVLLKIVDGDEDERNDFIIGLNHTHKPSKYWDPDDGVMTEIVKFDVDNDGVNEYVVDVDNDGEYEKVYDFVLYKLPDLAVTSVQLNPEPTLGSDVIVEVSVENVGEYPTNNFAVSFLLNGNTTDSKFISLSAKESYEVNFSWNNVISGTHKVEVVVDSTNLIFEYNETNNNKTLTLEVFPPSVVTTTTIPRGTEAVGPRKKGTIDFIGFPKTIEVEQGQEITVGGNIQNNLFYDLRNISITLEAKGLNESWYSFAPRTFELIERRGDVKEISLHFNIPGDAAVFTYPLTLKGRGNTVLRTETFSFDINLLIKEKEAIPTETTTTTVPPTEEPEKSSLLTGLFVLAKSKLVMGTILTILVLFGILVWMYYPGLRR